MLEEARRTYRVPKHIATIVSNLAKADGCIQGEKTYIQVLHNHKCVNLSR